MICLALSFRSCYAENETDTQTDFKIQKFEGEPVIYFEKIDEIYQKRGTWRIFSVMDFRPYKENLRTLTASIYELEHLCALQRTKSAENACKEILNQIDNSVKEIKNYDTMISTKNRGKRGIIAGAAIGSGLLLGWGATKVIEFLKDDKIEDLEEKTEKIEELLREQTSVLALTENILRKNQEIMNKELSLLVNQTAILFDHVDQLTRNAEMAERAQWISTHLLLMLSDFQAMQRLLLEIIVNNDEKLKTTWIKPAKIEKQIQLIEENLSEEMILGETLQEKTKMLYSLASTKSFLGENELILMVEVPLMSIEHYEWYKMHAIPIKTNEQHAWVKLNHNNFIVNSKRTAYCLLSDQFIHTKYFECDIMSEYNRSKQMCEAEIFLQRDNLDLCQFDFKTAEETWTKLFALNSFLFTATKNTTVHIDCGQNSVRVQLAEHGMISAMKKCTLKTSKQTILTQFIGNSTEIAKIQIMPKLGNSLKYNTLPKFSMPAINISHVNKAIQNLQQKQKMIEKNTQNQYYIDIVLGIGLLMITISITTQIIRKFF